MKMIRTILAALFLFSLVGCLEVEDNNSDEKTTTIRGRIVDAFDNASEVSSAEITIKLGSTIIADEIFADGGDFEIEDLPNQSDLEMTISSATDLFMSRTYYFTTGDSYSSTSNLDLGVIPVSEGILLSINVVDAETLAPIEGLQFEGHSVLGSGSSASDHAHLSTYNSTTQEYEIEVPKYIATDLLASVDLDSDGADDFEINSNTYRSYNYYTGLYSVSINSANLDTFDTIELTQLPQAFPSAEFRITLLTPDLTEISDGQIVVTDAENDGITSTYDATTGQHVVTATYDGELSLDVPAFEADGIDYQSASIIASGSTNVYFYSSNSENNFSFYRPEDTVYDLVLVLREGNNNSSYLEVVLEDIDPETNSYFVFYSQPVALEADEISFTSNGIYPIRGDEDDSDFILPGTTFLRTGLDVGFTYSLDLNSTRLTVTPSEALIPNISYSVDVGEIRALSDDITVDLSLDDTNFNASSTTVGPFDIADISLDNFNHFSNGTIINATNTAGIAASDSDNSGSVYLVLPRSISELENFSMTIVGVVDDGAPDSSFRNMTIVDDGYIDADWYYLLDVASNENISYDSYISGYYRGAASPDQYSYTVRTYEYLSDDTDVNENTITFEYVYEDHEGNIVTGDLTLPVN